MKKIPLGLNGKTKRGNKYNRRNNKLADGMSRTAADQKRKSKNLSEPDPVLSLMVNGTTDKLTYRWDMTTKTIHHPDDPSFTKRVRCLNDRGRTKLRAARRRANNRRMP